VANAKARASVFVIMPFDAEFNDVYNLFIKKTLEEAEFEVFRSDDLLQQRNILHDIVYSLTTCDLVVADLTSANSNVFYELGLAHALKKPVVMLTQNMDDVPFDLQAYRIIIYDVHFARINEAKDKLLQIAQGFLGRNIAFGNPVTDFTGKSTDIIAQSPSAICQEETIIDNLPEEDEKGLLDHCEDMERAVENLTQVIEEVTSASTEAAEKFQRRGDEVAAVVDDRGPGSAAKLRNITRVMATELLLYSQSLEKANERYEKITQETENSLELIVSLGIINSDDDRISLEEFIDTLNKLEEGAETGRETYSNLESTLGQIPKIEKSLNRALRATRQQLNRFTDNLLKTISSARRARELALRRLETPAC